MSTFRDKCALLPRMQVLYNQLDPAPAQLHTPLIACGAAGTSDPGTARLHSWLPAPGLQGPSLAVQAHFQPVHPAEHQAAQQTNSTGC
jgi:hypothetical protein